MKVCITAQYNSPAGQGLDILQLVAGGMTQAMAGSPAGQTILLKVFIHLRPPHHILERLPNLKQLKYTAS